MSRSPYFTLPSPFATEVGTILLDEPPEAGAGALRARLLAGDYDKPFVEKKTKGHPLYFPTLFFR